MSGYCHVPVLAEELISALLPLKTGLFVDGTVGGGGFAHGLMERAGADLRLLGLDVDPKAIEAAGKRLEPFEGRTTLIRRSYSELGEVLSMVGVDQAAGMALDLGISSDQLDCQDGFSFHRNTPLDMRMNPDLGVAAGDLIDFLTQAQLAGVLGRFGEIRGAGRLAGVLKERKRHGRLETSFDLARAVRDSGVRGGNRGVAAVFQALRIAVNGELDNLETFLADAPGLLAPGGALGIISFHSLEDRLVKQAFRRLADGGQFELGTRKPVTASPEEVEKNSRAGSAKLRWVRRVR